MSQSADAQPLAQSQSDVKYKGVWEPVNYSADVKLFDAFFVTAQEGWVSGGADEIRGGIILHTADGGDHWDVQYGDLQSGDRAIRNLRFLDTTHGWAMQGTGAAARLLHTQDGQTWNVAGTIPERTSDYMFTSETSGVALDGNRIILTADGGRTWRPVAQCQATVQVEGLTRTLMGEWKRLQFLTPTTGFAVGFSRTARTVAFVAHTSDGGASWNLITGATTDLPQDAFFIDDRTGYLRIGAPDTGQLLKSVDGGQTWTGMAGSPGARIQFADPEVGWAVLYEKVSFTTDAGAHWNSRQYPFPARVNAFSLPRRDHGYVVGEHGMIYRYRMVPETYTAPNLIPAPLLSGLDSPLENETEKLAIQIGLLAKEAGVSATPASASPIPGSADGGAAAASSGSVSATGSGQPPAAAGGVTFAQNTDPPSGGFTQDVSQAQNSFNAVTAEAPHFATKYRNLNLLLTGFAIAVQMPAQIRQLKETFALLSGAKDPAASAQTIAALQTQTTGLVQTVRTAFQKPR